MNRLPLIVILILALFAQMNPASCAGEWSVALPDENSGSNVYVLSDTTSHDCPTGSHEEAGDFCQCPCHLTFQTSLHHTNQPPLLSTPPYPDYRSPILPGFTGDILRPPLVV